MTPIDEVITALRERGYEILPAGLNAKGKQQWSVLEPSATEQVTASEDTLRAALTTAGATPTKAPGARRRKPPVKAAGKKAGTKAAPAPKKSVQAKSAKKAPTTAAPGAATKAPPGDRWAADAARVSRAARSIASPAYDELLVYVARVATEQAPLTRAALGDKRFPMARRLMAHGLLARNRNEGTWGFYATEAGKRRAADINQGKKRPKEGSG